MKTTLNHFLNFNKPIQPLCQRFSNLFADSCSWVRYSFSHVRTRLQNLKLRDVLRINQGDTRVAFRTLLSSVRVSLKEGWSNKRFRAGVIVAMVALPSWKCHLFFDINTRVDYWYYANYAVYFNTIRPYICGVFLFTGAFIALPMKWKFKWWAVPVVIFCITEIYCQSFYTDWTHFYQPMPNWQVFTIFSVSVPAAYFSMNYLLYRKYHLKDGNAARIVGIVKTPGLSWEVKAKMLEDLNEEMENYNARV